MPKSDAERLRDLEESVSKIEASLLKGGTLLKRLGSKQFPIFESYLRGDASPDVFRITVDSEASPLEIKIERVS